MSNIQEDLQKILSSRYGKDVRQSIHDAISDINDEGIGSRNIANNAKEIANNAVGIANNAVEAANTANSTADNAKEVAITSRNSAQASANTAAQQATASAASAATSSQKATAAANSANTAAQQATAAATSEANAKMWSDRAVDAAQSMSGGLVPRGNVNFEDLPTIDDSSIGDLYIILDDFTSTTDFEDGGGNNYPDGTKIYLTSNYKWAVEPSSTLSAADLLVTIDEL